MILINKKILSAFMLTIFFLFALCDKGLAQVQEIPGFGSYEIFSAPTVQEPVRKRESLFSLTARNALNINGLGGLFVANTADKLEEGTMFVSGRYRFHKITSHMGKALYSTEKGDVHTFEASVNWVGEFAEWAVTIPMHSWSLSAPRTFRNSAIEDNGLGNLRFAWKATYLPDKSYYRFAYGAIADVNTGHPEAMVVAGAKDSDELTLFGVVTTQETDRATANLELGAILNSEGENNRFLYRLGLTYEATEHASLIGELAGEVEGGKDKDSLDLIAGIRFTADRRFILEFAYTRNLRTYRPFGWDDRLHTGFTFNW